MKLGTRVVRAALAACAISSIAATGARGTALRLEAPRLADARAALPHRADVVRRLGVVRRAGVGGTYTVAGASVTIYLSRAYGDDQAGAARWASFLGSLVHGDELDQTTLYLAPEAEVEEVCESQDSLGCYAPGTDQIVAVGDSSTGYQPEAVVAHEYGHHIAAHRDNAPWNAFDWGTKRWSSYVGVCRRARLGSAAPGGEGDAYSKNPGEAFPEAYRLLNGQHLVGDDWPLVDRSFRPDARALALLKRDVLQPWEGPRHVRLAHSGVVSTPWDGTLELRPVRSGSARIELTDDAGRRLAAAVVTPTRPLRTTICGTRRVHVETPGPVEVSVP